MSIAVESAGTADYHVGRPPDGRMTEAATRQGLKLQGVARQATPTDFDDFDLILAMDRSNWSDLVELAPTTEAAAKLRMFRDFDPQAPGSDMPDPYYGGPDGFDEVVRIALRTADEFISSALEGPT